MEKNLSWSTFAEIDLRVGTIIQADDFVKALKPAYQLHIDFGAEVGILKSSAQITKRYTKDELLGKQVIAVVNFPDKQIANFISSCLVTGFSDENGDIVLSTVDQAVPNGSKLH